MTPQKERAEFELSMSAKGYDIRPSILPGAYSDMRVSTAWVAWQLRAALADDGQEVTLADAHPELAAAAEGLMSLSIREPSGTDYIDEAYDEAIMDAGIHEPKHSQSHAWQWKGFEPGHGGQTDIYICTNCKAVHRNFLVHDFSERNKAAPALPISGCAGDNGGERV